MQKPLQICHWNQKKKLQQMIQLTCLQV